MPRRWLREVRNIVLEFEQSSREKILTNNLSHKVDPKERREGAIMKVHCYPSPFVPPFRLNPNLQLFKHRLFRLRFVSRD